ncbi:MAG TPA: DUF2461 domain-containing protein [Firmicutes bacterium]|nr:DUF2461 domain-containing protein [Bacillota bacterium]
MATAARQQDIGEFSGFPKATFEFFRGLEENNNQEWFEAHRDEYMEHYVAPAQAFVLAMGQRLKKLAPGVGADPDYNGKGSIKKIFTDRRFNPDRLPYKSWLALMFWEGPFAAKKDNSAFYLQLSRSELLLAVGVKGFNKQALKAYREAVADPKQAAKLSAAISKATKEKGVELKGEGLKQVPRGYDADYRYADLLRHDALYVACTGKPPREVHSEKLLDYAYDRFKAMAPVHRWLVEMLSNARP